MILFPFRHISLRCRGCLSLQIYFILFSLYFSYIFIPLHASIATAQHKTHISIDWYVLFYDDTWFAADFYFILTLSSGCPIATFLFDIMLLFLLLSSFSFHRVSFIVRSNVLSLCWFSMPSLVIDLMDEFSFSSSHSLRLYAVRVYV